MIALLRSILCVLRQLGSIIVSALVDALNFIIGSIVATINAAIAVWPIDMPNMPAMPSQMTEALRWVAWSPIPVHAGIQLFLFIVTALVAWIGIQVALRWAKVID